MKTLFWSEPRPRKPVRIVSYTPRRDIGNVCCGKMLDVSLLNRGMSTAPDKFDTDGRESQEALGDPIDRGSRLSTGSAADASKVELRWE
jgi:hypothetical protein